jgi:hypothetical protein
VIGSLIRLGDPKKTYDVGETPSRENQINFWQKLGAIFISTGRSNLDPGLGFKISSKRFLAPSLNELRVRRHYLEENIGDIEVYIDFKILKVKVPIIFSGT